MLQVSSISRRFAGETDYVLQDVSFIVNAGDRTGIIGPNGSGKSTLLKIIMGEIEADTGSVQIIPSTTRIGYLAQGVIERDDLCVEDVVFPQLVRLRHLEDQLEHVIDEMTTGNTQAETEYDTLLTEITNLSERLDERGGHQALAELNMAHVHMNTPIRLLSGGQKTRLILARLIATRPQLILLDEPTNHLDIDGLRWLEDWLMGFNGGLLMVSHDRALVDRLVTQVVALDTDTPTAEVFTGNYSEYMAMKAYEREQQYATWKDQQDEIARMRADVSFTMSKAMKRENASVNDFERGRAKVMAQKGKAKEKRLERYLESDEIVDKPEQTWDVKMAFDAVKPIRGDAFRLEGAAIGYTKNAPLFTDLSLSVSGQTRLAITGANGYGKTTLLKSLLGRLPLLDGRRYVSNGAQIGYLSQEQEILDQYQHSLAAIQAAQAMTETKARSFLHYFLFSGDDPLRPMPMLSYGERTRLMLARLVAAGANVLVMDEPLNHLDIDSREKFQQAILNFNGTVVAILHDRYFVEQFATDIWHLSADGVQHSVNH